MLKNFPDNVVRLITPAEGAYSYMLSPQGAAKLLDEFVAFECHVDHYIGNVAYATVESDEPFKLGAITCTFYRQDDLPTTLHTEQKDTIVMTVSDYESMYPHYYENPYRYNLKTKSLDGLVSLVKTLPVNQTVQDTQVDRDASKEQQVDEFNQGNDNANRVNDEFNRVDAESILSKYVPVESHAAIRRAYWFNSTIFIIVSLSIMMLAIIVLVILLVLASRRNQE